MAIDVEILKDTVLFHGMDKDEIQKSLSTFHAHERSYKKMTTSSMPVLS